MLPVAERVTRVQASTLGAMRGPAERPLGPRGIMEPSPGSLVDPAAEVLPTGRFYRVVTKDGGTVTGRLLNIDTFTIQMMDTKEQLRSFTKSNLKEHGFIPSPMPSYKATLNTQELADVVSYLVSLKGRVTR